MLIHKLFCTAFISSDLTDGLIMVQKSEDLPEKEGQNSISL